MVILFKAEEQKHDVLSKMMIAVSGQQLLNIFLQEKHNVQQQDTEFQVVLSWIAHSFFISVLLPKVTERMDNESTGILYTHFTQWHAVTAPGE